MLALRLCAAGLKMVSDSGAISSACESWEAATAAASCPLAVCSSRFPVACRSCEPSGVGEVIMSASVLGCAARDGCQSTALLATGKPSERPHLRGDPTIVRSAEALLGAWGVSGCASAPLQLEGHDHRPDLPIEARCSGSLKVAVQCCAWPDGFDSPFANTDAPLSCKLGPAGLALGTSEAIPRGGSALWGVSGVGVIPSLGPRLCPRDTSEEWRV